MIKVKFAAVVTAAVTAVSIGSAQARPLPQKMAGVAISTRACPQLSQMIAATNWIAARKFLAVLS
jgi:hypothetical protein